MGEQEILYDKEDGVAIITLNRPDKLNAVTDDMLVLMGDILNEATVDDEVRAIIVTGNGRTFCAGTDVNVGVARDQTAERSTQQRQPKQFDLPPTSLPRWQFTHIPKPTIAAVNGATVGIGAEWTVQCDFRIASEKARFGWVFPLRGLCPDTGAGPYMLPQIVGMSNAMELLYTGEIIDAQKAMEIGLVSAVVPPEELMTAAKELAARLTRGAPLALKKIKEMAYGSFDWSIGAHQAENAKRFNEASMSEDAKEGVSSFLEKRPPIWKNK
ncbi:MAG: enoyl-CoA hydratase-related protein [Desulfobacterales bacterium]